MISRNISATDDKLFHVIDKTWPGPDCPQPETFTTEQWALLDHDDQVVLNAHVASCAACQVEQMLALAFGSDAGDAARVSDVARQIQFPDQSARTRTKQINPTWVPRVAAAAMLVCAIGFGALMLQRSDSLPSLPERDPAARITRGMDIALVPQATTGDQAALLRWLPVEGASEFVVTVRNAAGEVVLTERTSGLSVALPEVLARLGGRLHWEVVALDASGMPFARSVSGVYFAGTGAQR